MKKITALFILLVQSGFAQIPAAYYNTATGSGYTLKTQLFNIINNNTNSTSTATYSQLWSLFTETAYRDNYYENDGSLLDIYSEIPNGADSYEYTSTAEQCSGSTPSTEGGCYNKEHTMPQSVFNSSYPMYSDAHFVLPTDNRVNAWRDNYPYGIVTTNVTAVPISNSAANNANTTPCYTSNGSKLGQNSNSGYAAGYSGVVFEPIDEFKGDIARALLYFATRYQDQIPSWSYEMFNGTGNQVFTDTFLNILISWHLLDAVSPYEIAKNNAVYNFQGNRNPYIDHPEYVCQIWSTQCATLNTENFTTLNQVSIYPNPSTNGTFTIESATQLTKVTVYTINGQIAQEIKNPQGTSFQVNNLAKGFYLIQLETESASTIQKVIVN